MSGRHDIAGRLAIVVGVVAFASATSLAIDFVAPGPIGRLNDLGNGLVGILSGLLAWALRHRILGAASGTLALGAAVLGAAITVVGSSLVLSGTTGFFLGIPRHRVLRLRHDP
jgi:hypothetical protein